MLDSTLLITVIALIVFVVGTLILSKKGYERHFVLFMIRTKYGLRIIERLSKFSIWNFIADFSIAASLGGIGALYLASQNRKNLIKIFFIFGAFLLYAYGFFGFNLVYVSVFLAILVLLDVFLSKIKHPMVYFFIFSVLNFLIAKNGILIFYPIKAMPIDPYLAVLISIFGLPAFIIGTLVIHAIEIIFLNSSLPGVSPLLPSIKDGSPGFGFIGYNIFIPLWYGIISMIVLLVSHEAAHGVLARVHDIKIKSTGLLTLGILPIGAFVEPDEEEMKKRKSIDRMHVYVMGSSANFMIAVITTIILIFAAGTVYVSNGIIILDVMNNTPSYGVLEKGMIVYSINGKILNETLLNISSNIHPYENITLETNKGNFTLTAIKDPENETKGFIGINYAPNKKNRFEGVFADVLYFVLEALVWISILNLVVGLTNLMPIIPFDGGKMIEELISIFSIDKTIIEKIIFAILALGLMLIIINILPVFISH